MKLILLLFLPLAMKAQKVKDSIEVTSVHIILDTTSYKRLVNLIGQMRASESATLYKLLDGSFGNIAIIRNKIPKNENNKR